MTVDLDRATGFMTASARILDRHRFEVLVQDSDAARSAVVAALDAYRNPDGGYGWGLEPDCRARESQPAGALHALEALAAAGPYVSPHTPALLDWLDQVSLDDGGLPFALPIADPRASAPFWASADPTESSLQITAAVAAQAHRAARWDAAIHSHAWLKRATAYCFDQIRLIDRRPFAYVLLFSLQLLDVVASENAQARELLAHLMQFVPADGALPVDGGADGETVRVVSEPGRPLHGLLDPRYIAEELDRLERAQLPDGGWSVDFTSYSEAAALEWRGYTTTNTIATLRAHGRV